MTKLEQQKPNGGQNRRIVFGATALVATLGLVSSAGAQPAPTFGPAETFPTTVRSFAEYEMVDIDGDDDLDVVAIEFGGEGVIVMTNDGTGNYSAPTVYGSDRTQALTTGDIDGDGDVDIITALWFVNDPVGTIDVRFNDGDGRFSTKRAYGKLRSPETGAALVPTGIEASDLDGDGDLDLALSGSLLTVAGQPGYFSTIRNAGNNGAGRPRFLAARVIDAKADRLSSITSGDWDNDGDIDLAATSQTGHSVSIFLNKGNGRRGKVKSVTVKGSRPRPFALVAADVNGDGFDDLLTLNEGGRSFSTLLNLDGGDKPGKAGRFKDQGQMFSTGTSDSVTGIAAADFDLDGNVDIVLSIIRNSPSRSAIEIFTGDGVGSFATATPVETVGNGQFGVAAADIDGDGDADLVSPTASLFGLSDLSVMLNTALG